MPHILLYGLLGILACFIFVQVIVRIVRAFYKFPIPSFLAGAIDNPLRRRFQPPDRTAVRHCIQPGMTVLEVGPGTGTYTVAAAQRVGEQGRVVAIDIEPKIIERVERLVATQGVTNIEARVADVYALPFEDGTFDAIYMIAVIGEIPDAARAVREFHRVLSPSGILVFSELLPDPDYPLAGALIRKVAPLGFRVKEKIGSLFYYTLIFEKEP